MLHNLDCSTVVGRTEVTVPNTLVNQLHSLRGTLVASIADPKNAATSDNLEFTASECGSTKGMGGKGCR